MSNWKIGINATESAYTDITIENTVTGQSPGFVNMAEMDFRLLPESACIDAGTSLHPHVLPAHNVLYQYVKHQSGEKRPVDDVPDIGAYEFEDDVSAFDIKTIKNMQCSVFPNPAFDAVTLKLEGAQNSKYFFQLFDFNGKIVQNRIFEGKEIIVHVGHLKPAVYFLKVYILEQDTEYGVNTINEIQPRHINTVKIIKSN